MFFAKVLVGPYCYVLIVRVSGVIILLSRECVCSICSAWFVFKEEVAEVAGVWVSVVGLYVPAVRGCA